MQMQNAKREALTENEKLKQVDEFVRKYDQRRFARSTMDYYKKKEEEEIIKKIQLEKVRTQKKIEKLQE